jgi:predicted small secreted protein
MHPSLRRERSVPLLERGGHEMRRALTAAAIASAMLIGGCNTVRGVGQDVRSLKEVVPGGSSQASANQPAQTPTTAQ